MGGERALAYKPGTAAALAVLLALAFWVRVDGIGERTLSHIESYAPGIPYPAGISDPPARLDQRANLLWAINDVHGPFWYLWMLPYAHAFGTDPATLRLPAALFGVGTVFCVFLLGRRVGGDWAGLAAAGLIALSGHHVFWSQRARFYAMGIFLGAVSTVWLIGLLDRNKGPWRLAGYAAATLCGLATLYYYWVLFAAQCAWVALAESRRGPRMLVWMILLAVVAAPFLTLAVYQARPAPYLGYPDAQVLAGFFGLGFLFDPAIDTGAAERELVWGSAAGLVLAAALLGLAAAALRGTRPLEEGSIGRPPLWLAGLLAAGATAAILQGIGPAAAAFPHKTKLLWITAGLPAGGFGLIALLRSALGERLLRLFAGLPDIVRSATGGLWLLAFLPVAAVASIHQVTPFYAPRGMALFSPYLLVLMGMGLAWLGARGRVGAAAACVIGLALLPWHVRSVSIARNEPGAFDYKGLAEAVRSGLAPGDSILVTPHWSETPLFYYWLDEADRLVGADWPATTAHKQRVWVVEPKGLPLPAPLTASVAGWRQVERKTARRLQATLYERP